MMSEKILFVDDESNVLNALQRQFRKQYDVKTAMCGANALKTIIEEGPFAVIISDMQMPEMSGVQFLQAAQKISPHSVRIMLTGNADQETAVDAVNDGKVFNFLTKPCPPEKMVSALAAAVEQYHLVMAERELLKDTLNGAVKLLMDMMSMVAPDLFGRTIIIRDAARLIAKELDLKNTVQLELAAMLCNLASVTLPPQTVAKLNAVGEISAEEQEMITRLPEVGKDLICNIPRLEKVADIVYYHQKNYNGSGFPEDAVAGDEIPLESRLLKILVDMENLKATVMDEEDAIAELAEKQITHYDPDMFKMAAVALSAEDLSHDNATVLSVPLSGLRAGHVLVSDIETVNGKLLFATGYKIAAMNIERLRNYHRVNKIKEPIKVYVEADKVG